MRRKYKKGKFEDKNKYFKCPKCGAILDVERNKPNDRMGVTITENFIEGAPYRSDSTTVVMDTLSMLGSVSGFSDTSYSSRQVSVDRGCWFCGNVNF